MIVNSALDGIINIAFSDAVKKLQFLHNIPSLLPVDFALSSQTHTKEFWGQFIDLISSMIALVQTSLLDGDLLDEKGLEIIFEACILVRELVLFKMSLFN